MSSRWIVSFFILTGFTSNVAGETRDSISSLPQEVRHSGFLKKIEAVDRFLNTQDTSYVAPNRYNFTVMFQNNNLTEHYKLHGTGDDPQTISFAPTMAVKLGGYFGWKSLTFGWSFDVSNKKNNEKRGDFSAGISTAALGIDFFHRKSSRDFKIKDIKNIDLSNSADYNKKFSGLTVTITGIDTYWIFNRKKFSYPAAYAQSTQQLKSAGSVITGLSYSRHKLKLDMEQLPQSILNELDNSLKFDQLTYSNYSINVGYAYNWVFAKNWLLAGAFTPALALKSSRIHMDSGSDRYKDVNVDFRIRAGVVYNNARFFGGTTYLINTYGFKSSKVHFNDNFGTLTVYGGVNFGLKKRYRK